MNALSIEIAVDGVIRIMDGKDVVAIMTGKGADVKRHAKQLARSFNNRRIKYLKDEIKAVRVVNRGLSKGVKA